MKTIVYETGKGLYINATNRCTCNCEFCVRHYNHYIYGDLWLKEEPTVDEVLKELEKFDLSKYEEIVFCGYGEPTYRLDVIEAVSKYAHAHNKPTRINTNGHANKIHGKDVSKIIVDNIDTIGISLNEVEKEAYNKISHPIYGLEGFDIMLDFAKACIEKGGNVVFSVVDCIGLEKIKKAQSIADSIGAKLRVRELIEENNA